MVDIEDSTELVADLVRRDYERLVRSVALACGSMPEAEDAVQEALARAWDRASRGQSFEQPGAWVVTVALNLTRSGWRRRGRHDRAVEQLAATLTSTVDPVADEHVDLKAAVDRLPRRQREVVVLHYFLGFDVTSIASSLGVSAGTVKTALFRARAALAAALGEPEVIHD
jgi:RNA polymerase sigma-70 factor (ECF subfamily)